MFDFGFWELVVIMVVALLVVGPERLPTLARQAGQWIAKARRLINNARSEIERELRADELRRMLNEQQDEIRELKGMLDDTESELKTEIRDTDSLVRSIEEQIEEGHKQDGTDNPTKDRPKTPARVTASDDVEQPPGR